MDIVDIVNMSKTRPKYQQMFPSNLRHVNEVVLVFDLRETKVRAKDNNQNIKMRVEFTRRHLIKTG